MNPQLPWHRREQDIWIMSVTELTSLATARPPSQQSLCSAQRSTEICRKWNRGFCPFAQCCYWPVCFACQEPGHITWDCPLVSTSPKAPAAGRLVSYPDPQVPPANASRKGGSGNNTHSARRYCTIISDDGISMPIYIYIQWTVVLGEVEWKRGEALLPVSSAVHR